MGALNAQGDILFDLFLNGTFYQSVNIAQGDIKDRAGDTARLMITWRFSSPKIHQNFLVTRYNYNECGDFFCIEIR